MIEWQCIYFCLQIAESVIIGASPQSPDNFNGAMEVQAAHTVKHLVKVRLKLVSDLVTIIYK